MIPIWIYGLVALVLVALGFSAGWKTEGAFRDSAQLALVQKNDTAKANEATRENQISQHTEEKRDAVRTITQTITKTVDRIVVRPVYRNVCLDADGLRAANAALRGSTADPGKPDGGVPGPDATGGRNGGVSAPKAH